jgi:hypothetical protein
MALDLYTRFTVLRNPPERLRFRNGVVMLELVRDCSAEIPTWVFRAVKPAPRGRAASPTVTTVAVESRGSGMPTVSPIQRAMAAQSAGKSSVVIASSIYGRQHLLQVLRDGIVLADGYPAARVMQALVKLGYARTGRATARDL